MLYNKKVNYSNSFSNITIKRILYLNLFEWHDNNKNLLCKFIIRRRILNFTHDMILKSAVGDIGSS